MAFSILRGGKKKELEKRFTTFSEQLAQAFAQIKTDMSETNAKVESNQREMERIAQWIDYLNRSNQRLSEAHSKLLQKYEKMSENQLKLHSSHRELRSSHEKTARMAENLENRHQELSGAVSAHKGALKSELQKQLEQQRAAYTEEISRLKSWIDYFSAHIDRHKSKEDDLRQDFVKARQKWMEAYSKLRELVTVLKNENSGLKEQVSDVTNDLKDVRHELEKTRNMAESHILEVKSELSKQIEEAKKTQQQFVHQVPQPLPVTQQASQQVQQPQMAAQPQIVSPGPTSFQRHIISKVMPNRKGYVLNFILDLAAESKYSTKEVEEIIVNEKQLCGRTSFYAYLKELKLRGKLNYADIDERTILIRTDRQEDAQQRLSEQ